MTNLHLPLFKKKSVLVHYSKKVASKEWFQKEEKDCLSSALKERKNYLITANSGPLSSIMTWVFSGLNFDKTS